MQTSGTPFSFLSIGDWGGAALGGQDTINVYSVSAAMANAAKDSNAKFVINTGDNFYWCGIQSVEDFQLSVDFEQPYSETSLQVPWYSALGNHEYGYNVSAQILYSSMSEVWVMDDRYYTRRIALDGEENYLSLIFIDSSPCVNDYRSDSNKYWDPCGSSYPTCSLDSNDDDFEGECQFHENIISQDCQAQYEWFDNALSAVPSSDWLIVVGHHPVDEIDFMDYTSLLQSYGFDLYLNGHSHTLSQYTIDYKGAYVTTGAGSLVNTEDQLRERTRMKVEGYKEIGLEVEPASSHTYQTVFNQKVAGFTKHYFDAEFSSLTTEFISYQGEVVHSFTVNKRSSLSR